MRDIDGEEVEFVVVVMERKDSRLRLIGTSLEESERSMKKDLDSGEEANGSKAAYESPFGADGVEGSPVEIQESLARSSVLEFLSALKNRLLLLAFRDG